MHLTYGKNPKKGRLWFRLAWAKKQMEKKVLEV
jgi:hypothetical protein